jgi:hypothetical protein
MYEHLAPPGVLGKRTDDGIELADRNRLRILNVKVNVLIPQRVLQGPVADSDTAAPMPWGVRFCEALSVIQTAEK